MTSRPQSDHVEPRQEANDRQRVLPTAARAIPTTCIETIGGDPATAIRLSFQIKVF